jgi:acyl-coenzyme A thioesterase PaaI-like protein
MPSQPTAPDGHDLTLRVVPMPADLNGNGDVFGGWVMAQVDIAGGIAARARDDAARGKDDSARGKEDSARGREDKKKS